jgi:hypothetical protein
MAQALAIGAMAVSTIGTLASGEGQAQASINEGKAASQVANFQAKQLERQAGQERATSQLAAIEESRKGRLARSRALAVAAASGAGTDGSVSDILSDLTAEGEFNAQGALYEGEETAKGMEVQAAATRAQGAYAKRGAAYQARSTRRSSYLSSVGNLMAGGSSFYSKYWPEETDATSNVAATQSGAKFGRYSSQVAYG